MADNPQALQIPTDLTDILEIKVKTNALRNFLVSLATASNNQAKQISDLTDRVKRLENGNGNNSTA